MPTPAIPRPSTGKYMRQGHTAKDAFGSNPNADAMGKAGADARELKP